jgi:hypothetical protein
MTLRGVFRQSPAWGMVIAHFGEEKWKLRRKRPANQPVDRNQVLPQSVCGVLMASIPFSIRKGALAAAAMVLAPILLVSVVALAAGDWRQIGTTSDGDQVSISSVAAQKNGLRSAWVRVEYKEPTKLPQGGPFVELRARVRFNCGSGSAVPNSVWFYSRDHSGKIVVSKKTRRDDQFGAAIEGNFGEIAKDFVCQQR